MPILDDFVLDSAHEAPTWWMSRPEKEVGGLVLRKSGIIIVKLSALCCRG